MILISHGVTLYFGPMLTQVLVCSALYNRQLDVIMLHAFLTMNRYLPIKENGVIANVICTSQTH